VGFLTYTLTYAVTHRGTVSLGVVVTVGSSKELYDLYTRRGHPEVSDLLWTVAGGLAGFVITNGKYVSDLQ